VFGESVAIVDFDRCSSKRTYMEGRTDTQQRCEPQTEWGSRVLLNGQTHAP